MDSDAVMKLPTIDFRKPELKPGSEEWISVKDQVYEALVEYGCFEALLDGVPKERLYEKLKQVFKLPLESKFENSLSLSKFEKCLSLSKFENSISLSKFEKCLSLSKFEKCLSLSGYTMDNPIVPLRERITIEHPLTVGVIEGFSKIIWSDGDPEFCELVHSNAKRLSELDEMIRKMIFEKLGVEKYFDEHMKSTSNSIVLCKYKVPKPGEANVGTQPHRDNFFTAILSQHQSSGLQVMKKNGQWIDVENSSSESFIFLVGDCLTALTNDRLRCPYHRVIMGNVERYDIGLGGTPKEGCIVKVPEELVDEDHPLLYKPFDARKYLEFSLAEGVPTLCA